MDQDGEEIVEEIELEKEKIINTPNIKTIQLPSNSKSIESDSKIAAKLEVFLSSAEFTDCMQTFVVDNCKYFERSESGEHTHDNYLIFAEYTKMIESALQEFLNSEQLETSQLLEACKRVREIDESSLFSLDYVLACSEYEEFYNMMEMYNYEYEDKELENNFC